MRRKKICIIIVLFFMVITGGYAQTQKVEIKSNTSGACVDVFVGGKLFTSFCYPSDFEKPYLFPVNAPDGSVVTRGYPLLPRKGERVDHPHHVGMWFNHGDVNGLDFWNNSSAIKDKKKFGHIRVTKLVKAKGGKKAEIAYLAEWRDQQDFALLEEQTTFIITADEKARTIDRITTLKALGKDVIFTDNKEGMIAIRVDRAFETPSDAPQIFTDDHGNPTEVKAQSDNQGVNGVYYSSNGKKGDDVWATRNDWVMLRGEKNGTLITFGFFDHPKNVGYPFHSHARGYGLFASNNLGSQSYNKQDEQIVVKVKQGESLTFRHRFYIQAGQEFTTEQADAMFEEFSKCY